MLHHRYIVIGKLYKRLDLLLRNELTKRAALHNELNNIIRYRLRDTSNHANLSQTVVVPKKRAYEIVKILCIFNIGGDEQNRK